MTTIKTEEILINHHLPFPHDPGVHSVVTRNRDGEVRTSVSRELAAHLETLAAQMREVNAK